MIRALLDGRKTQTRRVMTPLPDDIRSPAHPEEVEHFGPTTVGMVRVDESDWQPLRCLYGRPGDRLRVKETFVAFGRWETRFNEKTARDEWHFVDMTIDAGFAYRFEGADRDARRRAGDAPTWHTRPSLFMPREASRITLDVTGVRVERLQDISEADASAEGIEWLNGRHTFNGGLHESRSARDAYQALWGEPQRRARLRVGCQPVGVGR
jgi:hypothetical protein